MMPIGVLGLYKPSGITSFDVVRQMKKITKIKKIGHGGTLDPMAEGVLPILLNEATSFFDVLLQSDKIYEAVIQLGLSTDTDDKEGKILEQQSVPEISLSTILEQIQTLTGEILQVPPAYSALKINGKKSYELARSGIGVELTPRKVIVHEWSNVTYNQQNSQITATIRCGSGTYIRSLARDLAILLNTKGHLFSLKRTYSGGIAIQDTLTLQNADQWQQFLVSPEKALSFLPRIEWKGEFNDLLNGKPLTPFLLNDISPEGIYTLMYQQKIVALIEKKENQWFYKKNLARCFENI